MLLSINHLNKQTLHYRKNFEKFIVLTHINNNDFAVVVIFTLKKTARLNIYKIMSSHKKLKKLFYFQYSVK